MAGKYNKIEILARGMKLIREQGYSKTGINEILAVCGIPKGSFYNFFASKEDFGFQAINLYSDYVEKMYLKFDNDPNLSALEKIKGFFSLSNDNFRREKCQQNCLLLALSNEVSDSNSTFASRVRESFENFKDYLSKWIEQGQKNHTIRSDSSPREMADFLYDSYHGATIRMKYQGSCAPLEDFQKYHLNLIAL